MSWTKASHWNTVLNPRDCGFSLSLPTVPFVRSSLTTHLRLELNTTVHCTIHGWTTCYHCTVHTYLWTPISHTLSAVWKIKEHNQGAQPGLNQISGLDITITSPLKFHHQHGRYHCQACWQVVLSQALPLNTQEVKPNKNKNHKSPNRLMDSSSEVNC